MTKKEQADEQDAVLRCSFCNKSQQEVKKLIAGPTSFICDECVDICMDIIAEDRLLTGDAKASSIDVVLAALNKRVAGQARAKRRLAAIFHNHSLRATHGSMTATKVHLLLLGPTGTGKSLCVRCLAESFDVPVAVVDATRLSGRSYFKKEDIFEKLLMMAGGNAERASRGVVVIDNFDKLASISDENPEGRRIQESLLLPLDGAQLIDIWQKKNMNFDTSRLLFVGCGDVSTLLARHGGRSSELATLDPIDQLTHCGFLPELVGRFGTTIQFEPLREEDLVQLMVMEERELLRQYQELFDANGVEVTFTDDAIQTLAREAVKRPGGARRVTSLLDNLMLSLLEEVSAEAIEKELTIDGAMVHRSLD